MLHDALYYQIEGKKIKCNLCPHNCVIANNKFGLCSVRINSDNRLKTINYGEITAIANDPIEKKPLYHFKPNSYILSVGSFGCNFKCDFCQNYAIAQYKAESKYFEPNQLVELSVKQSKNIGIAFTYNEPAIWYEYILDTATYLKKHYPNQQIVLVTNGFIEEKPLVKLLPVVDAFNIDLKSFNSKYYVSTCGGKLEAVLKSIEIASKYSHVEITTLLVNGLNDSSEEIEKIAKFIADINTNIPLHLSRYYPSYKMKLPATEIEVITRSKAIADQYLKYVYIGNVPGSNNSTYCPYCNKLLIDRNGYESIVHITDSKCPKCGERIYGKW